MNNILFRNHQYLLACYNGACFSCNLLSLQEVTTNAVVHGLSEQSSEKETGGASLFLWPVCVRPGSLKTSSCRELACCIQECSCMVLRVCLAQAVWVTALLYSTRVSDVTQMVSWPWKPKCISEAQGLDTPVCWGCTWHFPHKLHSSVCWVWNWGISWSVAWGCQQVYFACTSSSPTPRREKHLQHGFYNCSFSGSIYCKMENVGLYPYCSLDFLCLSKIHVYASWYGLCT